MAKQDKAEGEGRVLPDLTQARKATTLDDGTTITVRNGRLVIEIDISEGRLARAKPSKSGALCIVAGGMQTWNKLDELHEGMRYNFTLGIPNPAYDKEAAQRARVIAQAAKLGLKIA